jgi:L-cysteine desulfidase
MLSNVVYSAYVNILKEELVPAMGCTEPIAVAYAAANARDVLGAFPDTMELWCSANIVKNVKSVTVPNTGGLKGIEAAAIAGALCGDASKKLRVLEGIRKEQIETIRNFLMKGICTAHLAEGKEGLYIEARVVAGKNKATVVIENTHTGITKITLNGKATFEAGVTMEESPGTISSDRREYGYLNIRDICSFAEEVNVKDVEKVIRQQIVMNSAIADEGLAGEYGVSVGKTLLKHAGQDVRVLAKARAAAGSDARMGGCALPVVINSGSGNQGLTVSLPVIEYARSLGVEEERLVRALVVGNLISLHQKEYIGKLSAYCGAVSAAVGSAAAITWLKGGTADQINATITNAIATADGIVCDGAKASCAAKIATALEAALLAHEIGMLEGKSFSPGEGLVGRTVEETIKNIGQVGSVGMRPTDIEIIKIMLGRG